MGMSTTKTVNAHTYTIVTNNVPRHTIDASELSKSERCEFCYLNWDGIDAGEDSATFVRYRGNLIDLGDMPMASDDIKALGFDGFSADTYFSGIAVRYFGADGELIDDGDSVLVALVMVS